MNCLRSYTQHACNHNVLLPLSVSGFVRKEKDVGASYLHGSSNTASYGLFEGSPLFLGQFDLQFPVLCHTPNLVDNGKVTK